MLCYRRQGPSLLVAVLEWEELQVPELDRDPAEASQTHTALLAMASEPMHTYTLSH